MSSAPKGLSLANAIEVPSHCSTGKAVYSANWPSISQGEAKGTCCLTFGCSSDSSERPEGKVTSRFSEQRPNVERITVKALVQTSCRMAKGNI